MKRENKEATIADVLEIFQGKIDKIEKILMDFNIRGIEIITIFPRKDLYTRPANLLTEKDKKILDENREALAELLINKGKCLYMITEWVQRYPI